MAFLLSIIVLLLGIQGINSLWTVSKLTAQSGGSVTIPCHYHRQHKDFPKFWCKGKNWLTCLTMRPISQEKQTGISFDNSPDELVMTMTMTNLRSSDTNRYWCAVKIRSSYTRTSLELTVTEGTPDLSVASNRVSGEEDGNVTVQCFYSNKFKDTEKKWCRSGNLHSCQTAQDIEPSLGAALQINDTVDGVYTVTLTGLKKTDAGWYWCMTGEVQVPVHISVDSRQLVTDANTSK
ncbi:polymeric immunoglobulin receptor-like protein [Labeo rohita]|nr:polymeric immunoglobulin receptor-like protein [Labeo rohita]